MQCKTWVKNTIWFIISNKRLLLYCNSTPTLMHDKTNITRRCKCVVCVLRFFNFSGGAFPFTVGRIEHGYNMRPDLCATNCKISPRGFLGKFYTDALVHDAKALNLLVDIIGEVCIFYLSDLQC